MTAAAARVPPGREARDEASLHDRLRADTRDVHDAAELALDWRRRVADRASYRALLARWWGVHARWEQEAAGLIGEDFLGPRRRLALLAADLRHLGLPENTIAKLPICRPMVRMNSEAEALGAMYVLEGSTLGGQIIARAVQATLGLGPNSGCAYFNGYGPATGIMWRAFRDRLATMPASDHEKAVAAATATFAGLGEWLTAE